MYSSRFAFGLVAILANISISLHGQMLIQAQFESEMLPVVRCTDDYLEVIKNGDRRHTHSRDYEIRPGGTFGEGFVEIRNVKSDLNPLRNATPKERADPSAVRFRYEAELVANRSLSDCYVILTFVTEGSVGTHMEPVGRLGSGSVKRVKIELPNAVGTVGTVHVFSEGAEIRTTQHPDVYDVRSYYDSLLKGVTQLSAAELLKFERSFPHVLSRDGKLLATVREREAKQMLIVYDLATMKLLCEARIADSDAYAGDLTWVSDHEVAYVAQDDVEDYPHETRLHLLDTRTGETRLLKREIRAIVEAVVDNPEVLVVVDNHRGDTFYKYNVHTGKIFDFEDPMFGEYRFDRHGNARIHLRYDGDKRVYSVRQTPTSGWKDLDDITKQPGLKFNLRGPELLDRSVDILGVGPDGDTLYISTRLGTDPFALAAFSMSRGVITQTIAKLPRFDLNSEDGGLLWLLFQKNGPRLLGMVYEDQKPRVAWIDPRYAQLQKSIDATFPGHVNYPLDWSEDGSTFIYFSTNDQDPGTYYAYRPAQGELIPLLKLGERLEGKKLAKTVPIDFVARDGKKIPAYVTRPIGGGAKAAPLIVLIHGGPMARDHWGFDAMNQFFASRGYEVLQVNYRGSSGYGAEFQKAGLRSRLDTVIIDDLADGARYLIERGEVDPNRVVAMGGSFGGWATYISLAKYSDLYRAGVAIAAVSDLKGWISEDRWATDVPLRYRFWKALLDRPEFADAEKFIEPYLRAAEIKQPVFIIHGEGDYVVHAIEAREMLNALKKHNSDVQSRSFPNATHTYWPFADRVEQMNEIADFLDRHLSVVPAMTPAVAPATDAR